MNILVVGVGGVGEPLVEGVCYALKSWGGQHTITLQDGDKFEPSNRMRYKGVFGERKVDFVKEFLERHITDSDIEIKTDFSYFDEKSVVANTDVVFSCVDNHKGRAYVQRSCLDRRIMISGGNEAWDGNAQIYRPGQPPIWDRHPEIYDAMGQDGVFGNVRCDREPQRHLPNVIIANLMVALFVAEFGNTEKLYNNLVEIYWEFPGSTREVRI